MEIETAYKKKMAAQLKVWDAEIYLLESKLENFGADVRIKRAEELHELRAKQYAASMKIKELGKASGDAWRQVKETADAIWEDLKAGLAGAQAKFK